MARPKKLFLCMNCQQTFGQWSGKCPNCGEWNTLVEQSAEEKELDRRAATTAVLTVVGDIKTPYLPRLRSKSQEFDRVLGASDPGIVPGAVILMAGAPGVGKSTLLLQIAASVAGALYFSAEESLEQIRLRTNRLKLQASQLTISAERDLDRILAAIQERQPSFVVIDSIQTIYDTAMPWFLANC
jgi:DNA repair protein RadA/Sms